MADEPHTQFGEGTLLEVNDGDGGAFVAFAELVDIDPPGVEFARIERKRLSQTASKERVTSNLADMGEMGFTYEVGYANFSRVQALLKVPKSYRLTYVDGLRLAFTATRFSNKAQKVQGETIVTAAAMLVLQSVFAATDTSRRPRPRDHGPPPPRVASPGRSCPPKIPETVPTSHPWPTRPRTAPPSPWTLTCRPGRRSWRSPGPP